MRYYSIVIPENCRHRYFSSFSIHRNARGIKKSKHALLTLQSIPHTLARLLFTLEIGPNLSCSDAVWWQTQPGLEAMFRSSQLRNLRTLLPLRMNLLGTWTSRTFRCFPSIPPCSSCFWELSRFQSLLDNAGLWYCIWEHAELKLVF